MIEIRRCSTVLYSLVVVKKKIRNFGRTVNYNDENPSAQTDTFSQTKRNQKKLKKKNIYGLKMEYWKRTMQQSLEGMEQIYWLFYYQWRLYCVGKWDRLKCPL